MKEKICTLFLNFTPCGHCGRDCDDQSQSIFCEMCCKWFHCKCKKITMKEYNELSVDPNMYICSDKCKVSTFPFTKIDAIDLMSTIFGDGCNPCIICGQDCLDGMECLQCDICDHWFHTDCRYSKCVGDNDIFSAHDVIIDNHYEAICSEKCYVQLLPFSGFRYGTLVKNDIFLPKKIKPTSLRESLSKSNYDPSSKEFSKLVVLVIFHNYVRSLRGGTKRISDFANSDF